MAKNERKKTACPGGTCGAEALMQIAIAVKTQTERTLSPMPRSGFIAPVAPPALTLHPDAHAWHTLCAWVVHKVCI